MREKRRSTGQGQLDAMKPDDMRFLLDSSTDFAAADGPRELADCVVERLRRYLDEKGAVVVALNRYHPPGFEVIAASGPGEGDGEGKRHVDFCSLPEPVLMNLSVPSPPPGELVSPFSGNPADLFSAEIITDFPPITYTAFLRHGESVQGALALMLTRPIENDEAQVLAHFLEQAAASFSRLQWKQDHTRLKEDHGSIMAGILDAVLILNLDGSLISANPSARRLFGFEKIDVGGDTPIVKRFSRQAIAEMEDDLERVRRGEGGYLRRYKAYDEAGNRVWIEAVGGLMPYRGGSTILVVLRDITKRVQAENLLRKSEERYRTILDSINEGYFEVDLEGRPTFCNDVIPRMQHATREEFFKMTFRDYMTPESAAIIDHEFRELYLTGIPRTFRDYEVIARDGSRMIHELSASLIRDVSGSAIGFRGIVRDVTEKKRVEEALRESELRYRTILESINEGYFEVDLAGRHIACNGALARMHGMTREGFLTITYRDYMTPESADRAYKAFNRVYRTGVPSVTGDYDVVTPDGRNLIHELSVTLMRDRQGKIIGFRGLARDVTEQRRAERAVAASEKRYRSILENTGTALIVVEDDIITFANAEFEALWGYDRREIEGIKTWVDCVFSEDRPRLMGVVQKYLADPATKVRNVSLRLVRKTWDIRDVHATISWIPGTGSSLVSFSDMTEYKKLEARFIEAQKLEAIGTLAGGIAHNFNNLLMGIQGNASLALMGMKEGHAHRDRLRRIEEHVRSGAELTAQLLGFARGGKYEVVATDLNRLIEKTVELFESTRRDIKVHKKLGKDVAAVNIDRSQVEQVLLNILLNAWQAMPTGGDIVVATRNATGSHDGSVPPGRYVEMAIADQGTGMDEATKERIFEPFFTTREPERGRTGGLGLASAYGIVNNHGGYITVDSKPGKGSTFFVYLPGTDLEDVLDEASPSESLAVSGRERLLIVDDEAMVLEVGKDILESLGYEVLAADSGKKALRILEEAGHIDLVLLDMVMPEMSGGEIYDRIRTMAPNTRVLLSSGYSVDGEAQIILDRGCDGFIQKPFNINELSRVVRELLDRP